MSMRFTADRAELSKALAVVGGCQDSHLLAVYGMALLEAGPNTLRVRGSSLGCDVSVVIPVETESMGSAAAETAMLRALVDSLGGSGVLVNEASQNITLSSGRARRRVPKFVVGEFPAELETGGNGRALSWVALGRYLDRVVFGCAAEGEISMPVLTGVCVDWHNGLMLSTDRKKMLVQEVEIVEDVLGAVTVLPANELKKLKNVAGFSDGGSVTVSKVGAKMRFDFAQSSLVVSSLVGAYPSQMAAQLGTGIENAAFRCSIPLEDFKRVGGAMRAMTRSSRLRHPLHLSFDGDTVQLSLEVAEVGQLEEKFQLLDVRGSMGGEVLLDAREFGEILQHLEGESFSLAVRGRREPLRIGSSVMPGWSLYLMPMVTKEDIEEIKEKESDF